MTISLHIQELAGKPVRSFDGTLNDNPAEYAWKLGWDWDSEQPMAELLQTFLNDERVGEVEALVIGVWDEEMFDTPASDLVQTIADAAPRLTNLRHIFFGDIVYEECEISWIVNSDHSPLLNAYPKLESYTVRGGMGLRFQELRHPSLRSLTVQTGGMSTLTLRDIAGAVLPNLEALELWIGTEYYEGTDDVQDVMPLLSGKLFPKLTRLGLKNAQMQDEIAIAAAGAPVIAQLRHLDMSMGCMGDEGGNALADSPLIAGLETLDVSDNYLSADVVARLEALPCAVAADGQDEEEDPEDRFCNVAE